MTVAPDSAVESVPGVQVYDPWTVHTLTITLSEDQVDDLRAEPRAWVRGAVQFNDLHITDIGVRLKGSSSFQTIDQKPAWKLKFDEYVPGRRLMGLERMTLNNEVWDPTMLAENMGYRAFRENGALAPRTGYVEVTLNERYLGLYALIETMDDDFLDARGIDGGAIWEMTRDCDFTGDCTCFEPQEGDSDAIFAGCQDPSAFDLERLVAFLAVEQAVNHPDSYSWNLNNFFVVHDPGSGLALSPWGADSTFIYAYPPSTPNPDCQPLYRDVDTATPKGWLRSWCRQDVACSAAYDQKLVQVADWMDQVDLVQDMKETRDFLEPWAEQEVHVNWTLSDRDQRSDCFEQWTAQRPDALR